VISAVISDIGRSVFAMIDASGDPSELASPTTLAPLHKLASSKRSRWLVQDAPTGPEGTHLWIGDFAGLLGFVQTQRHTLATVMDNDWCLLGSLQIRVRPEVRGAPAQAE